MEEGARRLGIELIKQYAASEQAELKVRIKSRSRARGSAAS